jgi:urea transporter
MGLALGNFFQPDGALWIWVPILAVVVAGVTVAMSKWLPFPFLAAPFILTFWAIWPLADLMGLSKIDLGAFADEDVLWAGATISALGSALFAATVASGLLFLAGVLVSSWRCAVVALFGAFIAVALATQADVAGASINSGFVGFNGVLAALAAYAVISKDLRLVLLASVLATWLFSYVNREWPAPALASGFVLAIWFILLLGWLNPRFVGVEDE